MERKREVTKALLAESFKELMLKSSFDKITIKMITDAAGVIRPTFYNYFQDKHEVMEWLLEEEVFKGVRRTMEEHRDMEAIHMIFKKIEKEKGYYQKAFEVTGQNGFEEILTREMKRMVELLLENHEFTLEKNPGLISKRAFVEFQTATVVSGLKLWIMNREQNLNADEAMEFYVFLMSHSILDIIS